MEKVCVFLADGFEETEGLTVVDLLRRAGIETEMVSIMKRKTVTGSHGIRVEADSLFEDADMTSFTMLVLPGGMPGAKHLGEHEGVCAGLKSFAAEGKRLGAICAAPGVLGKLGLLEGKKAVCYPGIEKQLEGAVVLKEKAVADGLIVTGRGMGTVLEFGLLIIEVLADRETAYKIRKSIVM